MKFRKPQWSGETAGRIYFDACMKLISDLPEEFEILGPGQTAINGEWPRELTKERLEQLCREAEAWQPRTDAIRALAAIAPERKKRRVTLWKKDGAGSQVWTEEGQITPIPLGWSELTTIEIDD